MVRRWERQLCSVAGRSINVGGELFVGVVQCARVNTWYVTASHALLMPIKRRSSHGAKEEKRTPSMGAATHAEIDRPAYAESGNRT